MGPKMGAFQRGPFRAVGHSTESHALLLRADAVNDHWEFQTATPQGPGEEDSEHRCYSCYLSLPAPVIIGYVPFSFKTNQSLDGRL